MIKSGYKIIDLKSVVIDTEAGTTITGLYELIEGNNGKPLLLENVVVGDTEYTTSAYIAPYVSGSDIKFTAYDKTFTVDSDDLVTVA